MKLQFEALREVLDRLQGKAPQAIDQRIELATSNSLPPNWDELTPAQRAAYLDNHLVPQLGPGSGR